MHSGAVDACRGIAGCGSRQAGENHDQRAAAPCPTGSAETERLVEFSDFSVPAASGVRDGDGPPQRGLQEEGCKTTVNGAGHEIP